MKIQESAENYLETILVLQRRNGMVRSIDVANEMNFSKASISVAMKHFKEDGYVLVDAAGNITLTEQGRLVAEKIYERHTLLASVLASLGVSEETARMDACRIEHHLSDESFACIKAHAGRYGTTKK